MAVAAAAREAPGAGPTAEQLQLVRLTYPGAEVAFACPGNYSGRSNRELMLVLTGPGQQLVRVGVAWGENKWTLHDIDRELKNDDKISHHGGTEWEAPPHGQPAKCNASVARDQDLSARGKPLGRQLFRLPPGRANACFATSAQYNNWDCIAFDAAQGRFRLWYQQVFAD